MKTYIELKFQKLSVKIPKKNNFFKQIHIILFILIIFQEVITF